MGHAGWIERIGKKFFVTNKGCSDIMNQLRRESLRHPNGYRRNEAPLHKSIISLMGSIGELISTVVRGVLGEEKPDQRASSNRAEGKSGFKMNSESIGRANRTFDHSEEELEIFI